MANTQLILRPAQPDDVHRDTHHTRYTHDAVCDWITTSQSWLLVSKDNQVVGDALVVVTGPSYCSQVYAVVRLGDLVRVIPCAGIKGALRNCGIEAFTEIA